MQPKILSKILLIFLAFIFWGSSSFSQLKKISGWVKDPQTEDPIPFASVQFINSNVGALTDSSGSFSFSLNKWPSDTLKITCVGYQPFYQPIKAEENNIQLKIVLERGTFSEAVIVKSKVVNKGLLVWRKIVKHKPENDRYRFDNFSYELYNKLELDLRNINFEKFGKFKPLKPISDLITSNIDSSEGLKYLPAFFTEVLSDYYYQKKPLKRREIIKAANTSGVKNESAAKLLGGMDQVVNVYSNFISVFNKQFISPISDNGDYYYNYRVVDTQFINNKRFYHLVFVPKRVGGDTFEGDCWVNTDNFAIQKMNLRLGKAANVNFVNNLSLIQEYTLINDSTWFLAKDKFVADLSPLGKDRPGFIGRKTTTYRNVVINDSSVLNELTKNKVLEEVLTLPGSDEKNKEFWNNSRHEELSKTEAAVMKMIDTLLNAPIFQRFTRTANFIGTGYLNVGNFQIGPWYNWVTANYLEGTRIRFDLGTNKKFDKKWWWHTYLAYGFADKKIKGKAELFYLPKKNPRLYYYASYTNDIDWGQNYYGEVSQDNVFALAIRKANVPIKFIRVEDLRFEFFKETRFGLSALLSSAHKSFSPLRNLMPKDSFFMNYGRNPLTTTELSVRLRIAYLEKFLENNFFRSSLGSPYPIAEFILTQGVPGILKSSYSYTKIAGSISGNLKTPPFGKVAYYVYAGKTFGTVPYMFLDVAPGNDIYYYNKYAFNLMNRWEFIHDRYAGINIEHNIGNGIFRLLPKLKWRQFWTAKSLWGSITNANHALNFKQGYNFQSLNGSTYLELGTGIDNIFKVIRVDFIWRVFPSSIPKIKDERFGVFGSFRLVF